MSRSAADATRFTATGPYASSKPSSAGSSTPYKLPAFLERNASSPTKPSSQMPQHGGRQETPKQKVERLRAQARAARLAQSTSRVDRAIEVGRRFANSAHKGMVYTLIAASGICGALTIYSVISLTLYNRRQKALWLDNELEKLQNARSAYASGTATSDQLELLKIEEIGRIMKQKREEEKSQRPWNKAKSWLFGGLKTDEEAAAAAAAAAAASSSATTNITAPSENRSAILDALNNSTSTGNNHNDALDSDTARAAPTAQPAHPGMLDMLAENAETAAKQTTRSWTSWLTGR